MKHPMLVRAGQLQKTAGSCLVIDARPFAEYAAGHIPGAINLDLFAFHWVDTGARGMEGFTAQARQLFSFCGVSGDMPVVFYDGGSGMAAPRGLWMLRYLSHPDARVLDGGFAVWSGEGLPVQTGTNAPVTSAFRGNADPSVVAGFEYVRDHLDDSVIIDARSPQEYDGRTLRAARAGHIPNSLNMDYRLNLDADGTIKGDAELKKLYPFSRDAQVITYCHGGYRAASTFLALKKIGFERVRLYLGSWGEWGNMPGLPVG